MGICSALFGAALLSTALAIQCLAQGTQAKENASQYYAHGQLSQGDSIGADFLGKYLPIQGGAVYSDEYVFVEVALFAPAAAKPGAKTDIEWNHFKLKVNGQSLTAQPPGMVTLEGNFPEMVARPQVILDGGAGNGQIEVGGTERKPRFPGDDPSNTPQPVPRASTDASDGQVAQNAPDPGSAVKAAVLPEGAHTLPVSGYLCFVFEGKLKKIKHAELEYAGPLGKATLTLR
jgi:hypothetical protein